MGLMRIISLSGFFAVALAGGASAEGPLSAEEFEAYTTGKTLTYSALGEDFGIEEYLEDRRVRWSFLDGECQDGAWYPAGEMICFVYDDLPGTQCWTFYRETGGLRALFMNDPEQTELYETRTSDAPMLCLGPKIGV
ncbi:hypothetical protein [Ovoidimarina sediminis]|uniref:hypothetical protein n=1 Tax=Ovoidimarina sediminis TaxID=3079856 RepID=UPI00290D16E2|nr:hypothetical protein [Rhodophyticola sp. MJ-SS7]MDU8942894.1 hypothetical protein [Rhodophyticola sp. MJ-SS7]